MTDRFRGQIIALARKHIGTPYRHQGARNGVGCDCLGLIRSVWQGLYGVEPEEPGPYAMDWAERSGEERLFAAACRHMGAPMALDEREPGDLLLFRWRSGASAKHAGILTSADRFIHAYEQAGVVESALVPAWRRRIAYVFRFPEGGKSVS